MTPVRNQCEKKVNLTGPAEFVEFASSVENVVAVTVPLINTNRNVKDESEVLENISNNEEIETKVELVDIEDRSDTQETAQEVNKVLCRHTRLVLLDSLEDALETPRCT